MERKHKGTTGVPGRQDQFNAQIRAGQILAACRVGAGLAQTTCLILFGFAVATCFRTSRTPRAFRCCMALAMAAEALCICGTQNLMIMCDNNYQDDMWMADYYLAVCLHDDCVEFKQCMESNHCGAVSCPPFKRPPNRPKTPLLDCRVSIAFTMAMSLVKVWCDWYKL